MNQSRRASIFLHHKASSQQHSSHAADDREVRHSSEKTVTIINSVDYGFCHIEWECLNGIPDPSELVITAADDMIYMWQKAQR